VVRSVSVGITPWIRFHAEFAIWVASSGVELSSVRADMAIFVNGVVSADREDIIWDKFIPSVTALCASFFNTVIKAGRGTSSDDRASWIFNRIVSVPLNIADGSLW